MGRQLPPLNPLRAFEVAARHLSFTLAAKELFVTQGAISRQVKRLEEYLQAPLFQRGYRSLELTDTAKRYVPEIQEALNTIEHATGRLFKKKDNDRLYVKASLQTFAMTWLVPRFSSFRQLHPDLEVDFVTSIFLREEDFFNEPIDVAVSRERPKLKGLKVEEFMEEELVVVCSPNLLSGDFPLSTPADLMHHTLLHNANRANCWSIWLRQTGTKGIDTTAGLVFDSFYLTVQAAIAGIGVAVLPAPIADVSLRQGYLVTPLDFPVMSGEKYCLLYLEHRSGVPRIKAFRDWLFQEVQNSNSS